MRAERFTPRLGSKSPPNAWEGFFLIGIFPGESELRWTKVQVFSGGTNPSRHCLSCVEGMDGEGQVLVLRGLRDRIEKHEVRFARGGVSSASKGWRVDAPGVTWTGGWPSTRVQCDAAKLDAQATVQDVLVWVDAPRLLSYWSAFGSVDVSGVRGLGLVEHAYGGDSRIDWSQWGPRCWQWDVLAFDAGGGCAVLTIDVAAGLLGVRGGGNVPGERFETSVFARIDVDEWTEQSSRRVPTRWRGRTRMGGETLTYNARRSTAVADVVPGGGFLGFDFEARWKGRTLRGSGFAEYRAG